MKQYLKTYLDKYSLWTQLYGLVAFFGAFFVAIWEIPAYLGPPVITIFMVASGAIIFIINKILDDQDFTEFHEKERNNLIDRIARGDLPPERLDMYDRMFKR